MSSGRHGRAWWLANGRFSIRLELVGGAVDSATTYEPYGRLLARSGPSGTVYGFTGEQHDGAEYLRVVNQAYLAFLDRYLSTTSNE